MKKSIGIRSFVKKKRDKQRVIFRTIRNYWVFSEATDKDLNFGFKTNN